MESALFRFIYVDILNASIRDVAINITIDCSCLNALMVNIEFIRNLP